jgi:hypothetical protein
MISNDSLGKAKYLLWVPPYPGKAHRRVQVVPAVNRFARFKSFRMTRQIAVRLCFSMGFTDVMPPSVPGVSRNHNAVSLGVVELDLIGRVF